jgi:phosphoglucomutase/phosphomannomutase
MFPASVVPLSGRTNPHKPGLYHRQKQGVSEFGLVTPILDALARWAIESASVARVATEHGPMATTVETGLSQLQAAQAEGKITAGAVKNVQAWLTEPRYAAYAPQVLEHIAAGKWKELDDAFWTVIPFGTGGRRGRMYPIGCNVINDRTIGESAQGLADYVKSQAAGNAELTCGIAYDTRHNSRHFAELCAGIMVAAGFKVYFLDDYRSTPELSFLVRYKKCDCGIMVTASHNPPSDNAVKVYWSSGAQVLPPHDKGIIDRVMSTDQIKATPFVEAVAQGRVVMCKDEVDAAFIGAVSAQRFAGPRELKVIYSPLHGVGASAVAPVLAGDSFTDVEIYGPHREPSGDFPNVPGHVSNPENTAVFDAIIERAKSVKADLIMATDPDCDRLGCAAPIGADRSGAWTAFNGNQIAVLLCDYVLEQRKKAGSLTPQHYVVKTLVTTDMLRRIADSYGVRTCGNLQVGYKYIAQTIDAEGPDHFVFGAEESHGYLVGQYVRDKDGVVATMLMAELAALAKSQRKSLQEKLESLYWQHGYHAEKQLNVTMTGSEGMVKMKALMAQLRAKPPQSLAGLAVKQVRDYGQRTVTQVGGKPQPLDGPTGDMVILDFAEEGNYVAVRPSGTEPKVKFYMFTYVAAEQLHSLDAVRQAMSERIAALEAELKKVAASV